MGIGDSLSLIVSQNCSLVQLAGHFTCVGVRVAMLPCRTWRRPATIAGLALLSGIAHMSPVAPLSGVTGLSGITRLSCLTLWSGLPLVALWSGWSGLALRCRRWLLWSGVCAGAKNYHHQD